MPIVLISGSLNLLETSGPVQACNTFTFNFILISMCMAERRGVYEVLKGKPEGKRLLGSPRRRWEDSIKMDLQELGCGSIDWIELAQDGDMWRALVNAVMNLRVTQNGGGGNFLTS
jgi:hypothetical protein